MAVTFLLGAACGAVATYAIGWIPIYVVTPAPPPVIIREPAPLLPIPPTPPSRVDATPSANPASAPNIITNSADDPTRPTVTSAPTLSRLSRAILTFDAVDDEGNPRPSASAILVSSTRALVPLDAVVGSASATVASPDGGPYTVALVVGHDAWAGLAMVELAAPIDAPALPLRPTPLSGREPARMIYRDRAETNVTLEIGSHDLLGRAPPLDATPPAEAGGIGVDRDGQLAAIFPDASSKAATGATSGLAVHAAIPWLKSDRGVPLDAFQRLLGPGAPAARLRQARKLLAEKRFDEATRAFLVITAEEPRLIDELHDELYESCHEAVRELLVAGSGQSAYGLVKETLIRLPEEGDLWAMKGRALALIPDLPGAIDAFRTAAKVSPDQAAELLGESRGLLMNEVHTLRAYGRDAEALQLLLDLRRAFPDDGELRMTAGELLLAARRFEEAASLYDEAADDPHVAPQARRYAAYARDLAGGPGALVIDHEPNEYRPIVTCRIDGSTLVKLRVDPKEELVVLPTWAAQRAGYITPNQAGRPYASIPGTDLFPRVLLRKLSAPGTAQLETRAVLIDNFAEGADGVLGASFLSRFRKVEAPEIGRTVYLPR